MSPICGVSTCVWPSRTPDRSFHAAPTVRARTLMRQGRVGGRPQEGYAAVAVRPFLLVLGDKGYKVWALGPKGRVQILA